MASRPPSKAPPEDKVVMHTPARTAIESVGAESMSPAVTRAAAILDLLAHGVGNPAGPSEIGRRLGLPRSSIANICGALADAGLLRRVGTGFALGRMLAELGGAYLAAVDVVQEFSEACLHLTAASEETIQLAVLDGLEMTYLAEHLGRQPMRLTSRVGRRLPASATATGKAALAALDEADLRARLRRVRALPVLTPRSHATIASLLDDLDRVRARGYAVDDGETVEGVVSLGVMIPARQPGEGPYAASVTLLEARATDDRVRSLIADLATLRDRLSHPLNSSYPTIQGDIHAHRKASSVGVWYPLGPTDTSGHDGPRDEGSRATCRHHAGAFARRSKG
jgi:DNA-binding IclR family transcriptional regulator